MATPTHNGGWAPEITQDLMEEMRVLVEQGYKSASRRYRHIIRVPPEFQGNARGFESWCIEEYKKWAKTTYCNGPLNPKMPDGSVESYYARVYGGYPFMKDNFKTLTIDEYAAFRKVGGVSW